MEKETLDMIRQSSHVIMESFERGRLFDEKGVQVRDRAKAHAMCDAAAAKIKEPAKKKKVK